ILIVEFANQLRDEGKDFIKALIEAADTRFRPILMTGLTTVAGSIPLILASGAGSETRPVIGIVIFAGVFTAPFFTLFIVPVAYNLFAKGTTSPGSVAKKLEEELELKNR
ncbi:MAG: efflux RND transporter permease subunit, partial [Rickettsiales bacterium]|nr:efflux RND transporter permease subunit [Rickettsiales bacterium]